MSNMRGIWYGSLPINLKVFVMIVQYLKKKCFCPFESHLRLLFSFKNIRLLFNVLYMSNTHWVYLEACPAMGHKGHMPIMKKKNGGALPALLIWTLWNSKYYVSAPDEKSSHRGHRRQMSKLISLITKTCLLCPRGRKYFRGRIHSTASLYILNRYLLIRCVWDFGTTLIRDREVRCIDKCTSNYMQVTFFIFDSN